MIVHFVSIGGIVDRHCLNYLVISIEAGVISVSLHMYNVAVNIIGGGNWNTQEKTTDMLQVTEKHIKFHRENNLPGKQTHNYCSSN